MEGAPWTPEDIRHLLESNDRAVDRAMMALLDRQTRTEQQVENTLEHNRIGFSAAHAHRGTYYGKWCKRGRRLTGHHLDRARKIALRYTRQLAEIANSKR